MKKIFFVVILIAILVQCKHDTIVPDSALIPTISEVCDSDSLYFINDIQPLLISSCATSGCHDDQTAEHGVRLTNFKDIIQTANVRPFSPDISLFYKVLNANGERKMPPQNSLSDVQKNMIKDWIAQGAKNNECMEDCDLTSVTFSADISGIIANNCSGCHSGSQPDGGMLLTNYSQIAAAANSSKLYNVITGSNGSPLMPPGGSLSNCKIDKITKWIQDGAQNN